MLYEVITTELYTQFKYTELKGFDYHGGDGTVTRRDPSKVIYENGKYYVWYTYRNTPVKPIGRITSYNVCYTKLLRSTGSHSLTSRQLTLVKKRSPHDTIPADGLPAVRSDPC